MSENAYTKIGNGTRGQTGVVVYTHVSAEDTGDPTIGGLLRNIETIIGNILAQYPQQHPEPPDSEVSIKLKVECVEFTLERKTRNGKTASETVNGEPMNPETETETSK